MLRFAAATCATLFAALLFAPAAHAEVHFALDGDYTVPINDGLSTAGHGPHFGARLGWAFDLPAVDLVLEARGTTINFPSEVEEEKDGWAGFGVQGGARLGVALGMIRPAIFAHAGYGQTEAQGSDYVALHDGYLIDAGVSATFTLLPLVGVGAQVAWNTLIKEEHSNTALPRSADWLSFGLHLELRI